MKAAGLRPRRHARLLVALGPGRSQELPLHDIGQAFKAGDLVVYNDAATLPASLALDYDEHELELRLTEPPLDGELRGVVLGAPGWRFDTDNRPPPPRLLVGHRVQVAGELASVVAVRGRQISLKLCEAEAWRLVYDKGRPIQYSYHDKDLPLDRLQTPWASRPYAIEMPSAGRSLTQQSLQSLRKRGVQVHALTHAAGISATGDPELDAQLPFPERFEISERTLKAVAAGHREGRRIIAVGTSVMRALESVDIEAYIEGDLCGRTSLLVGPDFEPRWVSGILSGMHEEGTSHHHLMQSFVPADELRRLNTQAQDWGFQEHEFGDLMLVVDRRRFRPGRRGASIGPRDGRRPRPDGPRLVA